MTDDIRTLLNDYCEEAAALRFKAAVPGPHAGPQDILEALQDVRQRLDRIEFFLARAIRAKAGAHRASAAATSLAEEAWDKAIHHKRGAPVSRQDEFSSARERHAEANLTVLDERRAARSVADLASYCDEKTELLRLHHRGLGDLRHELLTILRTLQFESHLER